MRKTLFLLIIFTILLTSSGCSHSKEKQLSTMDESIEENPIDFEIEQIVLSKGFQSTDPNIEVIEENGNLKLLTNVGLIRSSGVNVEKVTKNKNTINIYIQRLLKQNKSQLAVPQVILEIEDSILEDLTNLNFNIVAQNYEPISIKFNKTQILEKVYADFDISPNTTPEVELKELNDQISWDIFFTNVINRRNPKSPLFNLHVEADANTGDVLKSQKQDISTYIDEGQLLDYLPNNCLIYKRQHIENNTPYESLWIYDITSEQKIKLYNTKYQIQSASFNPNGEYISLIEVDESKSDLYLINTSSKVAYKITPINYPHPELMQWKDNNNLYFFDIENKTTTLLVYNVEKNKSNVKFTLNKSAESFDILDNKIVLAEPDKYSLNKNIYTTEDGVNFEKIGSGFNPNFLDSQNIVYLENIEEKNKNILKIYNADKDYFPHILDYNITNYYKLNEENLLFVEKTTFNDEYLLSKYNMHDESIESISKLNSNSIFLNSNKYKAYITLTLPYKDKNINNIYCVDLIKLDYTKR
ncbi:hypothetical protein K8M07_11835 [Schnuerera sp. xch1]|uniref:hypothetical protein n=1 Tax=Schnuerera sp. xch1 TaxID=2874283 RepID=UPI001CBD3E39|nr:hypothetical protein [Schnuerera sp. xch1]MBZ2175928.1 hypothetical protein [Schnuerera sp. xch1]